MATLRTEFDFTFHDNDIQAEWHEREKTVTVLFGEWVDPHLNLTLTEARALHEALGEAIEDAKQQAAKPGPPEQEDNPT